MFAMTLGEKPESIRPGRSSSLPFFIEVIQLNIVARDFLDIVKHIDGNVANTDALDICVVKHKFGDDARGIGEVYEPCVGADSFDSVADILDNGNCALCLEEAADARCLLTDKVILLGNALVEVTAGKLADSYLSNNKVCALKSGVKVVGENNLAVGACVFEHSYAQIADDRSLSLINIHKGYLFELEAVLGFKEAVNKLRAIGAARSDNGNINFFHIILTPLIELNIYTRISLHNPALSS